MNKIDDLLQKEMTRKEFLTTVGFGVASIFGLTALLRLLGKENPLQQQSAYGYGDGSYGGRKNS